MSGTILMGYDVESASPNSDGFLAGAQILHAKHQVPWSIYLTGQTVENQTASILAVRDSPLLTICQHTYSHMLLKSIYMEPGDGKPVHDQSPNFFAKGGSLEEVREEITKTQEIIRNLLDVECCGMTSPWAYYRGLVNNPEILQILQDNGIKWIRSDGRDYRDCQPTPFTRQPFFYTDQGFGDILELGIQGYQDDFYWERFDDRQYGETYNDYLAAMIKKVAAEDLVWNVCSHDHETPTQEAFFETKGKWLEGFIRCAKDAGVRFMNPQTLYDEMQAAREQ